MTTYCSRNQLMNEYATQSSSSNVCSLANRIDAYKEYVLTEEEEEGDVEMIRRDG